MGKRREKRKGKRWSYTAGSYPHSVRVFERGRGGVLYVSAWDPIVPGEVKRSLGHRNREASKAYADEQAAKLRQGMDDVRDALVATGAAALHPVTGARLPITSSP